MAFMEAVTSAAVLRFRPIVLTSVTTYLGLLPLMFEAAVPARPLIPMAISLGYGVLYASVMTLFLVPCGYVIIDDLAALFGRGSEREKQLARPQAQPVENHDDAVGAGAILGEPRPVFSSE